MKNYLFLWGWLFFLAGTLWFEKVPDHLIGYTIIWYAVTIALWGWALYRWIKRKWGI